MVGKNRRWAGIERAARVSNARSMRPAGPTPSNATIDGVGRRKWAMIEGRFVRGLGQAAGFTRIDEVRRQFVELAAIDPFPGTVNLALDDDGNRRRWRSWCDHAQAGVVRGDPSFCEAKCLAARVDGRIPAAIVVPQVDDYPSDKVELVAALPLRRHLALEEGMRVRVELGRAHV